jgi:putative ABC transport system permease protein
MKIPFSYIFKNIAARKVTTLLTAGGMALVVFVFAAVLMLDAGLKKTLVGCAKAPKQKFKVVLAASKPA